MGNKKIVNELAIGIIVLIAIIAGVAVCISAKKQIKEISDSQKNLLQAQKPRNEMCKSHYYEGEANVRGWADPAIQDGEGIIVRLNAGDLKNLPIKSEVLKGNEFTVRIIDPDPFLQKKLNDSTRDKLATFTIRGYAEICEKKPPQVSINQASVAFKKS